MNKRQRKKQQKKQTEEMIDISAGFKNFGQTLQEAADKLKEWLESIPNFIDKQVQERPEELQAQLLGKLEKGGRLLRWEQLLLDKVNAELDRRRHGHF